MINYDPSKIQRNFSSKKNLKKLINKDLTINRAVLNQLATIDILSKKKIEETAIKVLKQYKRSVKEKINDGDSKSESIQQVLNDKKLLVQLVDNAVINQISKDIKQNYKGEYYIWTPSDASQPDPLHQLKYGKKFKIGVGEMPQDRYGCRCGMRILVDETKLDI